MVLVYGFFCRNGGRHHLTSASAQRALDRGLGFPGEEQLTLRKSKDCRWSSGASAAVIGLPAKVEETKG